MDEKLISENEQGNLKLTKKIIIVGGGLVGSLAALHLGQRGHNVHLYEYREDIRTAELVIGRSINLALSVRGRKALSEVGLEADILAHGIPMRGRMLHNLAGDMKFIPYDATTKQCIYSVGRKYLNEMLLTATEKYSNINLNFNQKLTAMNPDTGRIEFVNPESDQITETSGDVILGCDGAFSTVRKFMIQNPGHDFSQQYIEHGYLELCIPATEKNEFVMPPNYLHIWPRRQFMMIALPNQDRTWTVTLFMPFKNFDQIETSNDLLDFFEEYFPDAIQLIGEKRLIQDFFKTKPQHLVSIKCRPFNYESKILLMGDAAHAMVPFYGQGMNAGFEDCSLLSEILDRCEENFEEALSEFTVRRWRNAHAICDLAMYNYVEMRDLVTTKSYRLRKLFDDFLYQMLPNVWIPLYNSVSFSHMPYTECIENRNWQDKVVRAAFICGSVGIMGAILLTIYRLFNVKQF